MLLGLIALTYGAAQAAGTDKTAYLDIPAADGEYVLVGASFVPDGDGAVTTSDTNYVTLSIKVGTTTLGTFNTKVTGGAAMVAGTRRAFTLSGGASLEFTASSDVVSIVQANSGTGAVVKGSYTLLFAKKQADSYNV